MSQSSISQYKLYFICCATRWSCVSYNRFFLFFCRYEYNKLINVSVDNNTEHIMRFSEVIQIPCIHHAYSHTNFVEG